MPHEVTYCIAYAQTILSWQENLPKDDMPPEWMWTVDHELEIWFERLSEERDEKFNGRHDGPVAPMMDNELANELRGKRA